MRTRILTRAAVITASAGFAQMAGVDQNGDGALDEAEMTPAVEAGQPVIPA